MPPIELIIFIFIFFLWHVWYWACYIQYNLFCYCMRCYSLNVTDSGLNLIVICSLLHQALLIHQFLVPEGRKWGWGASQGEKEGMNQKGATVEMPTEGWRTKVPQGNTTQWTLPIWVQQLRIHQPHFFYRKITNLELSESEIQTLSWSFPIYVNKLTEQKNCYFQLINALRNFLLHV